MTQIFISHAAADEGIVEKLRSVFKRLGVGVLDPKTSASNGDRWAEVVTSDLRQSDGIVIVLPEPGSQGANNAFFQLGVARALGKPVLAVVPEADAERRRELPADLIDAAVLNGSEAQVRSYAEAFVRGLAPA